MPDQKCGCGHTLFSLRLQFRNVYKVPVTANYGNITVAGHDRTGWKRFVSSAAELASKRLDALSRKQKRRSGIGRQPADLVVYFLRRLGKVQWAKRLCEHRCITALPCLRHWTKRPVFQCRNGFGKHLRAEFCQNVMQFACGHIFFDFCCLMQKHVACVDALVHQHRGHAGFGFAAKDAPLDRRRSAIFRQK